MLLWPGVGKSHNRLTRRASLNERRRSEPEGGSIHADSTQLCHEYAWRRRGPGDARPAQGRRSGQPAPDRRCAGPSVEGRVAGLEMGSRAPAPVAGAFHHRAASADDGRGWRGSRGDRPAVLAWRPERLRARGGETLSDPLPRHGPHPAAGPQIGRSTSEMEGAAGDAGSACDLQQRADDTLAHGRHGELVLDSGRKGRASRHVFHAGPRRAARPHCGAAPTAHIDPRPHGPDGSHGEGQQGRGSDRQTVALAKYPNVSVKVSASPGISREPYPFRDVTVHLKRVFDAYGPQRSYWGTDLTNSYAKASYRQRISHFTEELSFLSESDKDWVMGRAIVQRLKWM